MQRGRGRIFEKVCFLYTILVSTYCFNVMIAQYIGNKMELHCNFLIDNSISI